MPIDQLPLVERAARFADLRDRVRSANPVASSGVTGKDRLDVAGSRLVDRLGGKGSPFA